MNQKTKVVLIACVTMVAGIAIFQYRDSNRSAPKAGEELENEAIIRESLSKYRESEFPKRGKLFEELALRLDQHIRGRLHASEEVVQILGNPSGKLTNKENTTYFYHYSRFLENDWTVFVICRADKVIMFSYNSRAANPDLENFTSPSK